MTTERETKHTPAAWEGGTPQDAIRAAMTRAAPVANKR